MLNSLLLAALIGGCQPAPETTVSAKPEVKTQIQTQNTGETGQKQDERRIVPSRNFQLKDLKKARITFGKNEFELWVMDTYAKRMEGMMFLENSDFKDNEGMIFVFTEPEIQRFWMKNTLVPLDVAYVGKDKSVVTTYTMKALDTETDYSSTKPAMYVIELRADMMKKKLIKAGEKVTIPSTVVSKD